MMKYGKNSFRDAGSNNIGFDKDKLHCYNYNDMGHFARECINPSKPAAEMKIVDVSDGEGNKGIVARGEDLGKAAHQVKEFP